MDKWINPMQCAAEDVPFADEHYLFEPKIDGHRLLLYSGRDGTRLYDGNGQTLTSLYPEWMAGIEEGMILDGEAAAVGEDGRSICFETVMKRRRAAPAEAAGLAVRYPAQYIVFDILQYRGRDLRGLPLAKRKEILASIDFSGSPAIGVIPFMEEHGDLLYEEIRRRGWEGMVAKKLSSMYTSGRSEAWRKVIFWQETEVAITGIRKRDRGWLASVPSPAGAVRPVGVIGDGVRAADKMAFYRRSRSLAVGEDEHYVYLAPEIRATVKARGWTGSGQLRSPFFVRFVS